QFPDGRVQAFIESHIRVGRPQLRLQLLAGDHFARALQQDGQNPKRLLLQLYFSSLFVDFARAEVNFEESGANTAAGTGGRFHEPAPRDLILSQDSSSGNSITPLATSA